MTRRALPYLSLGLLLGSCSLINSYDDVAGSGGSSSTSSSTGTGTTSSGGGGTGGDDTSSSSSAGGGGGAPIPTLVCSPDGAVVTVVDPPANDTTRIDAVRVFPQNGSEDRLTVVRNGTLQMYEIRDDVAEAGGTATASRFLDIQPSGPGISALAVHFVQGQPQLAVFRWLDNDPIQNAPVPSNIAEVSNDDQRAAFRHRGPLASDVDVLLMSKDPDSQLFDVAFRRFGNPAITVPLVNDAPTREAGEPRGFLVDAGRVHAFVGTPQGSSGETVHYDFALSATDGGSPLPMGGPGTFLSDISPTGAGFSVVFGEFADITLILRHGSLPLSSLPALKRDDVPVVHTFSSLTQIPMSNPPYLIQDTAFLAGFTDPVDGVGENWRLMLGKVGLASQVNGIRFDDPDFLTLQDSAHVGFGQAGHVGTREAVSGVGGSMSVAWTERTEDGADALYFARYTCSNED